MAQDNEGAGATRDNKDFTPSDLMKFRPFQGAPPEEVAVRAQDEIRRLTCLLKQKDEALEPFAKLAETLSWHSGEADVVGADGLKIRALRRAKAARELK